MKKLILICLLAVFASLPGQAHGQTSSDLLKEYLFPIQYAGITNADVIGLRIYKNLDNKDPLTWYKDNVSNPKETLPSITVDGYKAVRDDRTIYVQAANWSIVNDTSTFYTNIYVLAYNQNAQDQTVQIFNQMIDNLKFNKNIMDLYCLKSQYEAVKDRLRRDTIRKADYYDLTQIFQNFSGTLDLGAGTYVPNMSISTWPSWNQTLGKQLGATLPVDPLNVMAVNLVTCSADSDCGGGQCSGGYCSLCQPGWDPHTCWNERTKNYQPVDGFVYKFDSTHNILTIRYEYTQITFPAENKQCILGCDLGGKYYGQGECQGNAQYCNAGVWEPNTCGDGIVRCNEACDPVNEPNCLSDCLGCKSHYHSIGSLCLPDTQVVMALTQSLSATEEQRWTGNGWSAPYATSCKDNAMINSKGQCVCDVNFHENNGSCVNDTQTFTCAAKPDNSDWNKVGSYVQTWDGTQWLPADSITAYNETADTASCRFVCSSGFNWNGSACVSPPVSYNCTGTAPDHSSLCSGSNSNLNADTALSLADTCSGQCTYVCDQYYHRNSDVCDLNSCQGTDPDPNSAICNGEGDNLPTNNIDKVLVSSCNATNKCEYQCKSGFQFVNGACQEIVYNCSNPPANATICQAGANNSAATLVSTCSGSKCEYTCNSGFQLVNESCQAIVYNCTNQPANASLCDSSDQNLSADTPSTLSASCTGAACEYICNQYYHLSGNSCVTYACTGTPDSNATLCSGDNVNLTADTAVTAVNYCTSGNKCEYQCKTGYILDNSNPRKCVQGNLAFVTSEKFAGNLGGVTGADAKCQAEANARGVAGTFSAWISTGVWDQDGNLISDVNPENHFVQPPAGRYYRLIDGTQIANGWAGLASGGLLAPINKDLNYPTDPVINPAEYVWTNTLQSQITGGWGNTDLCACSGSAYTGNACKDYTSNTASDSTNKALGSTGGSGFNWTQQGYGSGAYATCNTPLRLYCFGQNP